MDGFDRTGKPGASATGVLSTSAGWPRAVSHPGLPQTQPSTKCSRPEVPGGKRHSETLPAEKIEHGAETGSVGGDPMQTTLSSAVETYLRAKRLACATRNEYFSTVRKWDEWGGGVPIQHMGRRIIAP